MKKFTLGSKILTNTKTGTIGIFSRGMKYSVCIDPSEMKYFFILNAGPAKNLIKFITHHRKGNHRNNRSNNSLIKSFCKTHVNLPHTLKPPDSSIAHAHRKFKVKFCMLFVYHLLYIVTKLFSTQ